MEQLESRPEVPRRRRPVEPARVPRRFGVGGMLLLVTLYGLVFSLLRVTEAHALACLFIAGFLAVIAVGQMLLFGGEKPRLASFLDVPHAGTEDEMHVTLGRLQSLDRLATDHPPVGHDADRADTKSPSQAVSYRNQRRDAGDVPRTSSGGRTWRPLVKGNGFS